jgi:hypothetical protein
MSETLLIDPNTLWWTIRETLRALHTDPSQRHRAVELVELLARWLKNGGEPPQV